MHLKIIHLVYFIVHGRDEYMLSSADIAVRSDAKMMKYTILSKTAVSKI